MKTQINTLNPLDIVVLLKLSLYKEKSWLQTQIAEDLFISQSEVSRSLARLTFARLVNADAKGIMRLALMDVLKYGICYFFPQHPGPVVRGVPTSHSAPPLNDHINSSEDYVWPSATGTARGHSIVPLYPNAVKASKLDPKLYELLAMTDALRVGKVREKEFVIKKLEERILDA